jgi:Spy/CpxP family protein refolding chaperone
MAAAGKLVMKALKVSLVLGLVFAVGVVVGAVGAKVAVQKVVEQATRRPEMLRARIEREFVRELKLTPEQRPKVHDIFVRSHEEIQGLRKDFQPRLSAILKRSEREIREVLHEEQREKFDRLIKRRPIVPPPNVQALPQRQ